MFDTFIPTSLRENLLFQAIMLALVFLAGDAIGAWLSLPIPGSVVGFLLALGLFSSGIVTTGSFRRGAQLYIGEMLLFFIPAVLAVLDHRELLGVLGLKILAVILIGTLLVMLSTALSVELALRIAARRDERA